MALIEVSRLMVANMALRAVGQQKVTQEQLTASSTNEAVLLNDHYDIAVTEYLRNHWWSFARKFSALTEDTDTTHPTFEYVYEYPIDCVEIRKICTSDYIPMQSKEFEYEIVIRNSDSERGIACNIDDAYLLYTFDVQEALWSMEFAKAVAWNIASCIVADTSGSAKLQQYALSMASYWLTEAVVKDKTEQQMRRDKPIDALSSSRFGDMWFKDEPGVRRDNADY
jgi:hypothetical protein